MKLTADTVTDEQIRACRALELINHAEWSNALFHPTTQLGRHARARCAEILNARNEVKP